MIATRLAVSIAASSALIGAAASPLAQPPQGKIPYDRVCKVCHGEEGKGDAGPRLVPFEHDADEVLAIVREGTGQMPPIAVARVSDEEVAAIVSYLRSLTPRPPDGK